MYSLALKRKFKGIYEVEADGIKITISNPRSADGIGTDGWELTIENKETGELILNDWFTTKRGASTFGAKWVVEFFENN